MNKKLFYILRLTFAGIVGILSLLAIFGIFYKIKFLDLQFAALLQRTIFDYSLTALIILLTIVILTILFGRFYCSILCPFGILQEFIALIMRRKNGFHKNLPLKYFLAVISFGMLIGGSALAIRYLDPYTIFGSAFSCSAFGLIVLAALIILVFFKNRYFCTNICPVGALLGVISKISLNKIYIDKDSCLSCSLCAKECPSGCIDHKEKEVDNVTCIKCMKCLGTCKRNAIKYGIKPKKELKFNPKRRDFIWTLSSLVLFGAAIKAGIETAGRYAAKVRDIIIPPGALNTNRMANKCLNCNLCIENCPNKILKKTDENYPAVHIDYSNGEGYCKYDCNECTKVCPSGAIQKISLEEKQRIRIAMAMINSDKCNKCGLCALDCPKGAIIKTEDNRYTVNGQKCIGCGKCKISCKFDAIEIFAVNEQRMV